MQPRTAPLPLLSALLLALAACGDDPAGHAPLAPPAPLWSEAAPGVDASNRGPGFPGDEDGAEGKVEAGSAGLHLLRRPLEASRADRSTKDEETGARRVSHGDPEDRRGTRWRSVRLGPTVTLEDLRPSTRLRHCPRGAHPRDPEFRRRELREAAVAAGRVLGPDLLSCRLEPQSDGTWQLHATLGPEGLARLSRARDQRIDRRAAALGVEGPVALHLALVADGVVHGVLTLDDPAAHEAPCEVLLAKGLDPALAHELLERLR